MSYARSPFRDFENYFRIVVDLDEHDIQLILIQYSSYFITYEILPGIHTVKDKTNAVYTKDGHDRTIQIEYDDIRVERKLILILFGLTFGVLSFHEKSFLIRY